jgi:2-polyprenyl-3-methyl-5-hydroxy-6-metoxy-1,4-benzoquinol methylase
VNAVERWRETLADWAIPEEILSRAEESPWAFSPDLMRRWAEAAIAAAPTTTTRRALEALPEGGTVLDVGAGSGAASLPLAPPAARIVAVDASTDLLVVLRDVAETAGVAATVVEGSWPDVAPSVPIADVAVCQHVLYNVSDLGPFARALNAHAAARVVLALTSVHPLTWMSDLWMHFYGLVRPTEPTANVAEAALLELGFAVRRQDETRSPRAIGWEDRGEVLARLRRQLCLPSDREAELADVLGDRLVERDGLWYVEPSEHPITTLWWDTRP